MSDIELPEPAVVRLMGDEGFSDEAPYIWAWVAHGYDTGMEPYFSADQLRAAILADREKRAQAAQGAYAYAVYFPGQQREELVHDLDDLLEDLTNYEHTVTPLFATEASKPVQDHIDAPIDMVATHQAEAPPQVFLVLQNLHPRFHASNHFVTIKKVVAVCQTEERAQTVRTTTEESYHEEFPGYRQHKEEPVYQWTVEEMPILAALATQQEAQPQAERETVDKKINKRHALNLIQELIKAERDDAYDEGYAAARAAQQATGERG